MRACANLLALCLPVFYLTTIQDALVHHVTYLSSLVSLSPLAPSSVSCSSACLLSCACVPLLLLSSSSPSFNHSERADAASSHRPRSCFVATIAATLRLGVKAGQCDTTATTRSDHGTTSAPARSLLANARECLRR